ncbi:MAG: hypothetical protein ABSF90_22275 [Syntrophobacteraceae bacterium]
MVHPHTRRGHGRLKGLRLVDFVIPAKPAPEVSSPGAGIQGFPAQAGIQGLFKLFELSTKTLDPGFSTVGLPDKPGEQ